MAETRPSLRTVDKLEITILMDNSIDVFLPDTKEFGGRDCHPICHGENARPWWPTRLLGTGNVHEPAARRRFSLTQA